MPHAAQRLIHVDLKCMVPTADALMKDIARWAAEGATGVVFEWENTFPYPGLEAATRGYSAADVRDIIACCRRHGLHAIPLVQTFGHLEWLLSHDKFAGLREFNDTPSLIRACDEESRALLLNKIDALLAAHPDSPWVHLGADEARGLTRIDRPGCSAVREGACAAFLRHLRPLFERVRAAGKRPIIWADMPLSHPENIAEFPKDVIFCDWLYSPTSEYAPTAHGWGIGPVNARTLPTIPADRRALFETYWRMDADDYPARLYQFPYTPFLRDRGTDVIGAPATMYAGFALAGPHLPKMRANQREWLRAVHRFGGLGTLNTCWQVRGALREQQRTGHRAFLLMAGTMPDMPDDGEVSAACWRGLAPERATAVAAALDALAPPLDPLSVTKPLSFEAAARMHRPRPFDQRWEDLRRALADLPDDASPVAEHRDAVERAARAEAALSRIAARDDELEAWRLGAVEVGLRAEVWLAALDRAKGRPLSVPLDGLRRRIGAQADAVEAFMKGRYLPEDIRALREDRYAGLLRFLEVAGGA